MHIVEHLHTFCWGVGGGPGPGMAKNGQLCHK